MSDPETLAVYAARAADYAARFSEETPGSHLAAFIASLPEGGTVLDLGCGPARSAHFMQNAGLVVDARDASPEMADVAREKFGIDVKIETFEDLSDASVFDGVHASFSLLHAPKSEMPENLARISRALKPGGSFHIGLKLGRGEHRDKIGRFYAYYDVAEIKRLLADAGFSVVSQDTGEQTGLDGTVSPWIIILATKDV